MIRSAGPRRVGVAVATVVVGVVGGLLLGDLVSLLVMAALFVVAMIGKVVATERSRPTPRWITTAFGLAVLLLATRLVLWFGPFGAVVALLAIVLVLLASGADIG